MALRTTGISFITSSSLSRAFCSLSWLTRFEYMPPGT